MQRIRRARRPMRRAREKGGSVLAFAIVLPLFVVSAVAVLDYVRAVFCYNTLDHLASEASRYASVRSIDSSDTVTQSNLKDWIEERAKGLNTAHLDVNAQWIPANQPGASVVVRLDYTFQPLVEPASFGVRELSAESRKIIVN